MVLDVAYDSQLYLNAELKVRTISKKLLKKINFLHDSDVHCLF